MKGKITIELTTNSARMPDLGFGANWLMTTLPGLPHKDNNDKEGLLSDKYTITRVSTEVQ